MTNRINITISGIRASGKTRLAHKIAMMLETENVSVDIIEEGCPQQCSKEQAGVNLPMYVKIITETSTS